VRISSIGRRKAQQIIEVTEEMIGENKQRN
jgi:hypothetical protein